MISKIRLVLLPVPASFAHLYLKVSALLTATLPSHLVDFFMYPCVIDDARLRATFGWEPQIGAAEAVRSTVAATRR